MDRYKEDRNAGRGKRSLDSGKQPQKPNKPKKRSRLSMTHIILIVICIVLALTVTAVAVYRSLFVKPDLPPESVEAPSATEPEDLDFGTQPKVGGARKTKDWYTILVLGRDTGGGGNTDTMMLASYNVTDQKLTVMSIPRDTMVNVPWDIKRINSVYSYYGGGDKGIQKLYTEVSELVGFSPDYQVVIEWDAFGDLVEAIGGVWFDVPRNMDYEDPYQDLSIHVKKGYQLLNREQAMGVIRWRHNNRGGGYATGDLGRIETQQAFMKAVIEQVLKVQNVTKIKEFSKIFSEKVETDLSIQNLLWFGKSAILGGLDMANVNFLTMPNNPKNCWSRSVGNMQSYVVPKSQEMLDLVNNDLSPFVDLVTMRELDLMSINSDGSVSSTTGKVADAKAAVPPVKPSKEPPATQAPAEDDPTPPEDGTTTLPNGTTSPGTGTTTPPNGGAKPPDTGTTTPDGGSGTTPPVTEPTTPPTPATPDPGTTPDAGTTTPDTGETTTPPADTGETTTPPADTGEPGWSIPGEPSEGLGQ